MAQLPQRPLPHQLPRVTLHPSRPRFLTRRHAWSRFRRTCNSSSISLMCTWTSNWGVALMVWLYVLQSLINSWRRIFVTSSRPVREVWFLSHSSFTGKELRGSRTLMRQTLSRSQTLTTRSGKRCQSCRHCKATLRLQLCTVSLSRTSTA